MQKRSRKKISPYRQKQSKLIQYIVALLILSISFVLMPYGSKMRDENMFLLILAGMLFWIGLISTIVIAWRINASRRANRSFKQQYPNLKKLGLIHFFQNKPAVIADSILFASLVAFIIVRFSSETNIGWFVALSITVFSFGMHCMLNGVNYIYINYRPRREKSS